MKYFEYDFSHLEQAVFNFKSSQSQSSLNDIKRELNAFFKGSQCKEIIYTKNTDKMFFGMVVMPVIKDQEVVSITLDDNDKFRVTEYYLEIDSKLLELNLNTREITACLLHEVGHLVNDSSPADTVKKALDAYLAEKDDHIIITDSIQYIQLLKFGIQDSLRKVNSIFNRRNEEIIADEFVVACGYGPDLEQALRKIVRGTGKINKNVCGKFVLLTFMLGIYKNVKLKRISALRTLNKAKTFEPSTLIKRCIDNVVRNLNQISDEMLIQESFDDIKKSLSKSISNFKYKNVRALEDEAYEYALRVKNVDEQDEALIILREINTRIALIDDYIHSENLDEDDMKRWYNVLGKYRMLREELEKKNTYDEKYFGLFVQTPIIKNRYEL